MNNIERTMYELIFNEYKKLSFTRVETAKLIGKSVKTLDNMKSSGFGPEYSKEDTPGGKGAVTYPIHSIVAYMLRDDYKKTA